MSQNRPIVALQLYTLRDLAARDMAGTLRQVAALGYEGIEFAGYGNSSAAEILPLVKELGLKVVSSHVGFAAFESDLPTIISEAQAFGNKHVVCPSVPGDQRTTGDGYRKFGEKLNEIGARLKAEAGLQLCYHNHAFELEDVFDGECGLDLLYANSDAQNVQAELDVYWVQKGGADPVAYIKKYSGRAPLIHAKDMAGDAAQSFAEVGAGILDWPGIFAASEAGGVVSYIVEQDTCPGNPLDSVRLSLENMKKWGKLG